MSSFFLAYKILLSLINLFGIWLIIWVWRAKLKSSFVSLYILLTGFLLFWVNGGYFFYTCSLEKTAFILGKLLLGFAFLSGVLIYFFVTEFPKKSEVKIFLFLRKIVSIIGIVIFLITMFTPFIIKGVKITPQGTQPVYSFWAKIIYYFPLGILIVLIMTCLIVQYFRSSRIEKLKLQYFLIGLFLFLFFNLIFNIFFPFIRGDIKYWQFGNYSIVFLLSFTAFAIVKRKLFGIRVVLTELLVGLIAILLLINFLISKTPFEYFWKGGLFIAFLIFGVLLIKSIIKEIHQREKLDKLATSLAIAHIRLEGAYKKLKKLDEAKSEFISIASHQLRTPLTAIKGYISMFLEGDYGRLSKKAFRSMKNVYLSNERLIKLVNSLLNVSRIETGKIVLEKKKVAIDKLLKNVVKDFENQAKKKKLYLKFKKPKEKIPEIQVDPEKLIQIIANILDNAIKYTQKGGITIELKIESSKLKIIISDTGEGMEKSELSKIFQSFSRAKAGRRYWTEGAGLGLYIARKFVEMHQGKIWAKSKGKGKGATFYVEFPLTLKTKSKN